LKPEQWGSPLVQEKYQEGKACDKRHPYRTIMIMMINSYTKQKINPESTKTSTTYKEQALLIQVFQSAVVERASIELFNLPASPQREQYRHRFPY